MLHWFILSKLHGLEARWEDMRRCLPLQLMRLGCQNNLDLASLDEDVSIMEIDQNDDRFERSLERWTWK